jgi:hypothetical protein
METVVCTAIPQVHSDPRRTISEAGLKLNLARITLIDLHGESPRIGDHYHAKETEVFLFVCGTVTVRWQHISSGGFDSSQLPVHEHVVESPAMVVVPPNIAHAFLVHGQALAVVLSDREFMQEETVVHKLP